MTESETAEELLDALDPSTTVVENTDDLAAIAAAADATAADTARLVDAVQHARTLGRSWTRIGVALGVSRQAARQRFARQSTDPGQDRHPVSSSSQRTPR